MGKSKNKYPYGLSEHDMFIMRDNRIVIHKRNKLNDYSIGSIHESKQSGIYKILSVDHMDKYSRKYFNIIFLKTGYKTIVDISHIKTGNIKDYYLPSLLIGKIYNSNNYGKFVILSYTNINSRLLFRIRFINTGYEKIVRFDSIVNGNIKDYFYKCVAGVGYLGDNYINLQESDTQLYNALKRRWDTMIYRCYKPDDPNYIRYGLLGVYVDKSWHNFSNFLKDAITLPGFNREKIISGDLQLDKDKLQLQTPKSKKKYSKNTCCWLTIKENNFININKN